jgi:RHS repeat-associated protein
MPAGPPQFHEVTEFGQLRVDSMVASGYVLQGGINATYRSNETMTYTPFGDLVQRSGGWGFPPKAGSFFINNVYDDFRRLTRQSDSNGAGLTWYRYDAAGSTRLERTQEGFGISSDNDAATRVRERAAFYGADDRLRSADLRVSTVPGPAQRYLDEYRYDALGRRVWVSTRKQCAGAGGLTAECMSSSVRRTIWDGTQELAEIQVPLDTFANTPVGTQELNTGVPVIPPVTCQQLDPCDPNPFYGRVVYGPGLATDQPLTVARYEYKDNVSGSSLTWAPYGLSVFWNYRGQPAMGLFSDGAEFRPNTPSPGQTACPSLISTATDRCVKMQWPFAQSAYERSRGRTIPGSWQGTLLANKVDGTGLEYMRNRVYDSQSGRFTQEDPIGLAGGLNLYGFANGDPTTFSDPFGLCPDCVFDALAVAADVVSIARGGVTAGKLAALGVDVVAAVIPGLPSVGGARLGAKVGETAATYIGRAAHVAWEAGEGFSKKVVLKSGQRPDAVNSATRTVKELKPDRPESIRRGAKQVIEYAKQLEQEYGGKWKTIVETYRRP